MNTLAKEGITPTKGSAIVGSKFGQAGVKRSNDQDRMREAFGDRRGRREGIESARQAQIAANYLEREDW